MIHTKCSTPINNVRKCLQCKKELNKEEIERAYEYNSDTLITVTDKELKELQKSSSEKHIEIINFVKLKEIDPVFYDKSYYVGPEDNSQKAYSLLQEALIKSGKIGVAKIKIRSKEQIVVLRSYENSLILETIHWPDEIRKIEHIPNLPKKSKPIKKELDTAILLIEQLTTKFDPTKYKNEYRENVITLMEQKAKKLNRKSQVKKPKNVLNLMSALEKSLKKNAK